MTNCNLPGSFEYQMSHNPSEHDCKNIYLLHIPTGDTCYISIDEEKCLYNKSNKRVMDRYIFYYKHSLISSYVFIGRKKDIKNLDDIILLPKEEYEIIFLDK